MSAVDQREGQRSQKSSGAPDSNVAPVLDFTEPSDVRDGSLARAHFQLGRVDRRFRPQ